MQLEKQSKLLLSRNKFLPIVGFSLLILLSQMLNTINDDLERVYDEDDIILKLYLYVFPHKKILEFGLLEIGGNFGDKEMP
jgi:hypothetical protein